MGIIINSNTRAIVQGITGKQGSYQTKMMIDYGTKIVAGVSPGKSGTIINGIPVFDTVKDCMDQFSPNASIIFVPVPHATDAVFEAIANKIKTIVVITEHLPIRDTVEIMNYAIQSQVAIIGPNTPGILTPGECKLGIMSTNIFTKGNIGLISRSGTLTYEVAAELKAKGLGQTTCIGIGGDPIVGMNFIETLELFKHDAETKAVVLIGEIGGNMEELTADYIAKEQYPKPIVAYIVGRFAPTDRRMGHAGAIITGKQGTAQSKITAFENAGITVAEKPSDVAKHLTKTHKL